MRQFNMIGRGERETLWHFIARCKNRITTACTWSSGEPLRDEAALLDVPFGAIEVRGTTACFLAEDGTTVVAMVPLPVVEQEKVQSFGGLGKASLRLVIDPMDRERAAQVMAGRTAELTFEGSGFAFRVNVTHFFTADQMEAIAWIMRDAQEKYNEQMQQAAATPAAAD